MYCRKCGNKVEKTDLFCSKCGEKSADITEIETKPDSNQATLLSPKISATKSNINVKNDHNKIKCSSCISTNVSTNKKGFSGQKAVVGAVLTGGIGILAGTIGSNKVVITCLSCGKNFNIGDDFESVKAKNIETKQMVSSNGGKIFLGTFLALLS
jgi:Zn finger protein HypA/HybF involved in hydrogenase expression